MTVCRFFLQNGNCRFGENCRFSHDIGGGEYNQYENGSRNFAYDRNDSKNGNRYNDRNSKDYLNKRYNSNRANDLTQHASQFANQPQRPLFSFTNAVRTEQTNRFNNFSFKNINKQAPTIFHKGNYQLAVPTFEVEDVPEETNFSKEEVIQFEKPDFDLGSIPLKAPSKEFCK
eukprot:NODE_1015_length_2666_cov_0.637709.p3 type:complete len:173 gc:universal NODE_1015_length_2666_cov_0.637709:2303-1785(-)